MNNIDKTLKHLFSSMPSKKPTPPLSPKRSTPNSSEFSSPLKNMMGDWDKDGTVNIMDCKPHDKRYHGGQLYWDVMKKKGIQLSGTNREKKSIRRIFEKRPELLQRSGTFTRPLSGINVPLKIVASNETSSAGFLPIGSDKYTKTSDRINITKSSFMTGGPNKPAPPARSLTHELQHRYDFATLPPRQLGNLYEARTKGLSRLNKRFPNKILTEQESKKYFEAYKQLPLEKSAYEAEDKPLQRNIQVPQRKIYSAYRSAEQQWQAMNQQQRNIARANNPDTDGDRVPDKYDCQPRNTMRQDQIHEDWLKQNREPNIARRTLQDPISTFINTSKPILEISYFENTNDPEEIKHNQKVNILKQKYPYINYRYPYETIQGTTDWGLDIVFFKPGQKQRADEFIRLLKNNQDKRFDYDYHRNLGATLGYNETEINDFIRQVKIQEAEERRR